MAGETDWDHLVAQGEDRVPRVVHNVAADGDARLDVKPSPEGARPGLKDLAAVENFFPERFCGVTDDGTVGLRPQNIAKSDRAWTKRRLTWKLNRGACNLSQAALEASATTVFADWMSALPWFRFEEAPHDPDIVVDLLIEFVEMATTFAGLTDYPTAVGNLHVRLNTVTTVDGVIGPVKLTWSVAFFAHVLRHELGHALGFGHTADTTSVMYPTTRGSNVIDSRLRAEARELYGWGPVLAPVGLQGSGRPAIASDGTTGVALWRGYETETLYVSVSHGSEFRDMAPLTDRSSSHSPALTHGPAGWVALWKGRSGDDRLWTSTLPVPGGAWTPQQELPWRTSTGPAIATFGQSTVAAWRSPDQDEGIQWSYLGGIGEVVSPPGRWADARSIPEVRTSSSPCLVAAGGVLHLFWQGGTGDLRIWHAHLDPGRLTWSEQAVIRPVQDVSWSAATNPPSVVVTRTDLTSVQGVSACEMPGGMLVVGAMLPQNGVTFCVVTAANTIDWTPLFDVGFDSMFGQGLAVIQGMLVVMGLRSGDRFESQFAQRNLEL